MTSSQELDYSQHGADWTGICSSGTQQSPIDILSESLNDDGDCFVTFNFEPRNTTIVSQIENNGHYVIINGYFSDLYSKIIGYDHVATFENTQFHVHSPAEHTLGGVRYDLELHLIHEVVSQNGIDDPERNLAIIGILFQADESILTENSFLEQFTPIGENDLPIQDSFNFYQAFTELIQSQKEVYVYQGSLTTPPCTEDVNWFVYGTPVKVKKSYIDAFKQVQDPAGNYREVQPINSRSVQKYNLVCEAKVVFSDSSASNIYFGVLALISLLSLLL